MTSLCHIANINVEEIIGQFTEVKKFGYKTLLGHMARRAADVKPIARVSRSSALVERPF